MKGNFTLIDIYHRGAAGHRSPFLSGIFILKQSMPLNEPVFLIINGIF
jgi:hypothetical protein